jgi:hypothetical protein
MQRFPILFLLLCALSYNPAYFTSVTALPVPADLVPSTHYPHLQRHSPESLTILHCIALLPLSLPRALSLSLSERQNNTNNTNNSGTQIIGNGNDVTTSSSPSSSSSHGLTTSDKIGIGVGVAAGVIAIIGVVVAVHYGRKPSMYLYPTH